MSQILGGDQRRDSCWGWGNPAVLLPYMNNLHESASIISYYNYWQLIVTSCEAVASAGTGYTVLMQFFCVYDFY